MHYYIIKDGIVDNEIAVKDGDDPSKYGAIADERQYRIGDLWEAPIVPSDDNTARIAALEEELAALKAAVVRGAGL